MKREKRKCISTLLFQKGERHFDQMIDLVCHEKLSYKEKKESHYISNSRMAGFSHFLPNELFTDSAEGHLHSIYTWAMLPTRVCSFMRLFPEFSYVLFIYSVEVTMCSTSERNGDPVPIHLPLCDHRATGWSDFLQGGHYSIHENR